MSRGLLLGVIGALVIALGGIGYWLYQEKNKPAVELEVGGNRLTIQQR